MGTGGGGGGQLETNGGGEGGSWRQIGRGGGIRKEKGILLCTAGKGAEDAERLRNANGDQFGMGWKVRGVRGLGWERERLYCTQETTHLDLGTKDMLCCLFRNLWRIPNQVRL